MTTIGLYAVIFSHFEIVDHSSETQLQILNCNLIITTGSNVLPVLDPNVQCCTQVYIHREAGGSDGPRSERVKA